MRACNASGANKSLFETDGYEAILTIHLNGKLAPPSQYVGYVDIQDVIAGLSVHPATFDARSWLSMSFLNGQGTGLPTLLNDVTDTATFPYPP